MNIREVRLARLGELLAEAGGKKADLARRVKVSASQLSQWFGGNRTITEESARKVETHAGKPRGWLDGNSAVTDLAHSTGLVQHMVAPKTIEWGDLKMGKLPKSFGVVLPDDSMAPDAPKGALVWFETGLEPRSPDWVLCFDDRGTPYVREYKERRPGHWEAHTVNPAFLPLDSVRDGLKVAAVYVGMRARRG